MKNEFKQVTRDNNLSVTLKIIRNNGVVTKGVIFKRKEYDFFVDVEVENPRKYKICNVELFYLDKNGQYVPLKGGLGFQKVRLSTKCLDGNKLVLKVKIEYKLSFFERKQITVVCKGNV